jgi:glucose dehydrogenase
MRYNGPGNSFDFAVAIGVSPDGSTVFVTGTSTAAQTGQDYATVAYRASSGRLLWAARSVGTCLPRACYYSNATALGVSPDGSTVFVTGTTIPPDSDQDYATVAYRASSGKQLWATRYAPGGFNNYANAISVSPVSSAVFVTGSSPTNGRRSDYATVAYDATTGQQLWVERYNGPANLDDDATAIAPSPDGSAVFVTGFSRGLATSDDYATVAYDAATGDQLWVERYDGPAHFPDWAFAIAVSPDGSAVFVTGQSWSGTDYDYATVAYGST